MFHMKANDILIISFEYSLTPASIFMNKVKKIIKTSIDFQSQLVPFSLALHNVSVSVPEEVGGHFGLPVPGEEPLLVAHHSPDLLLGHEVAEHPGHLPNEPGLGTPEGVKHLPVLLEHLHLPLLREHEPG